MCATCWRGSLRQRRPRTRRPRCRSSPCRWPIPRATTGCAPMTVLRRSAMRDITLELKQLRLHGMGAAWADLVEQSSAELETARWLLEHLMQAEMADRAMRSVNHQMHAARFPVHRD